MSNRSAPRKTLRRNKIEGLVVVVVVQSNNQPLRASDEHAKEKGRGEASKEAKHRTVTAAVSQ